MFDYRLYIVGPGGHFMRVIHLDCPDDATAIRAAECESGVQRELWQRARKVAVWLQAHTAQISPALK